MTLEVVDTTVRGGVAASVVGLAASADAISLPITSDALTWAFVLIVATLLACAVWLVRFVMTTVATSISDISKVQTEILTSLKQERWLREHEYSESID